MAKMPFLQGDYVKGDFTKDRLEGFDAVVFSAGNDMRHVAEGDDLDEHLLHANVEAVPHFMRIARDAGVKRVVLLGTFYIQAAPDLEKSRYYMRSRRLACEASRAESRPGFDVISINPPFMAGGVPGLPSPFLDPNIAWAKGEVNAPLFAPAGGVNVMSYRSLSQAIEGALLRGEPGKAYLVGDENLTYAQYLSLFFKAAGNPVELESRDEPHPVFPDTFISQGRGNFIHYEPDAEEVALLGYARNDVANGVAEAVALYEQRNAAKN